MSTLEIRCLVDARYCQELTRVAHAAKRHWGYPEEWIAAWREDLTFTPAMLEQQHVYAAFDDSQMLGCVALGREDGDWNITHLWVMPTAMGRGLGRQLIDRALDAAGRLGIEQLKILSDPSAEPFYRHLGAQPVGEHHGEVLGEPRVLPILRLEVG